VYSSRYLTAVERPVLSLARCERLNALAPGIDLALVEGHLDVIPKVCAGGADAGPIGGLSQRERFHWLVAPRSTIIQTSPVHSGVHHDLDAALQGLFERLVRPPIKSSTSDASSSRYSSPFGWCVSPTRT
jgi:hypothetical protein